MFSDSDVTNYKELLLAFKEGGYEFVKFKDLNKPYGQIALRHDIDFDCEFALTAAMEEKQLGIHSTFFFLLRSETYNLFSKKNSEFVKAIKEMGHSISLHFDPLIYDDFQSGFLEEKRLFESFFNTEIDIISIHRPNEFFQELDEPIQGIDHSYLSKYSKDIAYYADSRGEWRYGHPVNSEAFEQNKSMQILTHPIWWEMDNPDKLEKLRDYYGLLKSRIRANISENCIPFREIENDLD